MQTWILGVQLKKKKKKKGFLPCVGFAGFKQHSNYQRVLGLVLQRGHSRLCRVSQLQGCPPAAFAGGDMMEFLAVLEFLAGE